MKAVLPSPSRPLLRAIACVCLFQAGTAWAVPPLRAAFARLEGNVTVRDSDPAGSREPGQLHRATLFKVISAGDEIRVSPRAAAGLVCSSDRWVELNAGMEKILDDQLCRQGRRLEAGAFAKLVASGAEGARSLGGAMVSEQTPRTDSEDGDWPILISPRNSLVLEGKPKLVWRAERAGPFRIRSRGSLSFRIELQSATCSPAAEGKGFLCTSPFPENAPALQPGQRMLLQIQAPAKNSASFDGEATWPWARRLTNDQAGSLHAGLEAVSKLPLSGAARHLARADLLAAYGLFSSAIEDLETNKTKDELPELDCALGKLYLRVDLARSAEKHFLKAKQSGEPLHQAEASFGLGQVERARRRFPEASAHFAQAELLFGQLGLHQEAAEARRILSEIQNKPQP